MMLKQKKSWILASVLLSVFFSSLAIRNDIIVDDYTLEDDYRSTGKYVKHQCSKGSVALKRLAESYNGRATAPNRFKNVKAAKVCTSKELPVEKDICDDGYALQEPFLNKRGEANIAVPVYDNYGILYQTQQRIAAVIAQTCGLHMNVSLDLFRKKHATIMYTGKTETKDIEKIHQAIEHGIADFVARGYAAKPMLIQLGGSVQLYGNEYGAGKKFIGVPAALDDRLDQLLRCITKFMPRDYKSLYRNLHISLGSVEASDSKQAQQLSRSIFDANLVATPFNNVVDKITLMPSQGRKNIDYSIVPDHNSSTPTAGWGWACDEGARLAVSI